MDRKVNRKLDSGRNARCLIRSCDRAALGTINRDNGTPYVSLVLTACDYDASPLLLVSSLAEHTKNICVNSNVSLLFDGTRDLDAPLTGKRLTIQGQAITTEKGHHKRRYLARHPEAAQYAEFGDFSLLRIMPHRAHLIAGFGAIETIEAGDLLHEMDNTSLAASEQIILKQLNDQHLAAMEHYFKRGKKNSPSSWRLTGCDVEGADFRHKGEVLRVNFSHPADDARTIVEAFLSDII